MLSLSQLTTPVTEDEALKTAIGFLSDLGFQATSWQSNGMQVTMLRLFARMFSRLTNVIANIASGGFTTLASALPEATWLTLLARYVYDLERIEAQSTIGKFLLTSSAGAPTNTWSAGDLKVSDSPSGTAGARTYTVTSGGTLGPNATLSIEFKADVAGADGNIPPGTTLYLWTPLVGVTVTNPALSLSTTWITTVGLDEESNDRLLARCFGRWARLSPTANTKDAYVAWALEALPELTRVAKVSAPGDGTVTIIGATAVGAIDAGQIATIEDYINGVTDGEGRRPDNDIFSAVGATVVTSPTLSITAYCTPAAMSTAENAIKTALQNYFGSLPIGGTVLTGTQGRVQFIKIVAITEEQSGVRGATFSISSDILLNPDEIYAPTVNVTLVQVAPTV